jgi:CRISPR-associated protein Csd2
MSILKNKIDFVLYFTVKNANPNGDPLMGNMPRTDYEGYGEVSDVCIKRKVRNRMQEMQDDNGNKFEIFVQSQDRNEDGHKSLDSRFKAQFKENASDDEVHKKSCEKWIDVRSFGQVMTFQKRSLGIRGPVSISLAKSLNPVDVISLQITRSTNGMDPKEGKDRSSDTMGTKHFVDFGVYKLTGSINCYFAEKTGFSVNDAEVVKESLRTLFLNDLSSARPEGSMEVKRIYWFIHPNKLGVASSAKIHDLVIDDSNNNSIKKSFEEYNVKLDEERVSSYKNLKLEVFEIEGM